MALTDEDLLDFDGSDDAKRALEEHGDAFRYQLVAARQLDAWAARAEVAKTSPTADVSWVDGQVKTLREVAGRLRKGDYLPGGSGYDETTVG